MSAGYVNPPGSQRELSKESKDALQSCKKIKNIPRRVIQEDVLQEMIDKYRRYENMYQKHGKYVLFTTAVLLIPLMFSGWALFFIHAMSDVFAIETPSSISSTNAYGAAASVTGMSESVIKLRDGVLAGIIIDPSVYILSLYGLGIDGMIPQESSLYVISPQDAGLLFVAASLIMYGIRKAYSHGLDPRYVQIFKRDPAINAAEHIRSINEEIHKAINGDAQNLSLVAKHLYNGVLVEKSKPLAVTLYAMAAEAGDQASAYTVSQYFKNGIGVQKNMDAYLSWLRYASSIGSYDAVKELQELSQPKEPEGSSNAMGYLVAGVALGFILKR